MGFDLVILPNGYSGSTGKYRGEAHRYTVRLHELLYIYTYTTTEAKSTLKTMNLDILLSLKTLYCLSLIEEKKVCTGIRRLS